MPLGRCAAGDLFIESRAQCARAAVALRLPDVVAGIFTSARNPHGCYFKASGPANKQLWFNEAGDKNDNDRAWDVFGYGDMVGIVKASPVQAPPRGNHRKMLVF